jgi:1-phosphofructokinase family hexose kinase
MIVTVTPNTALDRIEIVSSLTPGKVLRSTSLTLSAGGKGVNVARAIKNLGGEAVCAGFLGGHTGRQHAELVKQEYMPAAWTWIDGETRAAIVIVDEATGETTVINEDGPVLTPFDWDRMQAAVLKQAEIAEVVCLCGSLPLGLGPETYTELVKALNRVQRRVWVDSSGAALQAAVQSHPSVVKVNGLEAAGLLGRREFQDVSTAAQAARTIQQSGLSQVVLTLGKHGAVLASDAGVWYACPPKIKAICTIGSGDAFFGGLVQAWLNHSPDPDSLRQAAAAGSANALSVGGGKFTRQEFESILAETAVKKIT